MAPQRTDAILEWMENVCVEPNDFSYESAMRAWARCRRKKAYGRVLELMDKVQQPAAQSYLSLLMTLRNSRESNKAAMAVAILERLEQPTLACFDVVVSICAAAPEREREAASEALRRTVESVLEDATIVPSQRIVTGVRRAVEALDLGSPSFLRRLENFKR